MKKSDLLKEIGWSDQLIKHYMIDDSEMYSEDEPVVTNEIFEANSMVIVYDTDTSATDIIVHGK